MTDELAAGPNAWPKHLIAVLKHLLSPFFHFYLLHIRFTKQSKFNFSEHFGWNNLQTDAVWSTHSLFCSLFRCYEAQRTSGTIVLPRLLMFSSTEPKKKINKEVEKISFCTYNGMRAEWLRSRTWAVKVGTIRIDGKMTKTLANN